MQRRILEFAGARFKVINIPSNDRSLIWKLSKQRYYNVPIVRDGKSVIFEMEEESQVIAKYLDARLELGLFPWEREGVQAIVWRHIEGRLEELTFKINDAHWRELVPEEEQLAFIRHKERRFGRHCLEQWRAEHDMLFAELEKRLLPFEEMLLHNDFLLGDRPYFVDFDLFGMLGNLLYSGHERLPAAHDCLQEWYELMLHLNRKDIQ